MNKKIIKILSATLLLTAGTILYGVSFGNPFGVMNPDRKMTKQELIKATRLMASAEFEAVQNYMQVAESTDDPIAKKVFTDIANEERVHAGEFLRLLDYLDPEEKTFYQKGAAEVEKEIKELEKPQEVEPKTEITEPEKELVKKELEKKEIVSEKIVAPKTEIKETGKETTKKLVATKAKLPAKEPVETKPIIIEPINVVTSK